MAAKRKAGLTRRASAFRMNGIRKPRVTKETFELPIPYTPPRPVVPMPPAIAANSASAVPETANEIIIRKKQLPHAATAISWAALFSLVLAILFASLLNLGALLAFWLFAPLFICLSIIIYSFLDRRERQRRFSRKL
jgi:hypothetical protein